MGTKLKRINSHIQVLKFPARGLHVANFFENNAGAFNLLQMLYNLLGLVKYHDSQLLSAWFWE